MELNGQPHPSGTPPLVGGSIRVSSKYAIEVILPASYEARCHHVVFPRSRHGHLVLAVRTSYKQV